MSCSRVTPDCAAGQQGHAGLERPLLVQHERVRAAAAAERRQAVVPGQVGGGLLRRHLLGPAVHDVAGARLHPALRDAVHERRAGAGQLGDDEAAEHLGVGQDHAACHGGRRRRARQEGAGVDHGDAETGAADEPVDGVLAVRERRGRHGVDGPAVRGAARGRHLVEQLEMASILGHHDQRLGRAAQHGRELRDRRHVGRQFVRVDHGEDEVDVAELLLQRRHLLDVGERSAAPLSSAGAEDVDAVGPGAVVDGAGGQARAPASAPRDVRAMLRGAAASASSTMAAEMRTREPSTRAPRRASRSSIASCCTSTPVFSSSSSVAPWTASQPSSSRALVWSLYCGIDVLPRAHDAVSGAPRRRTTFHQEWTEVK